MTVLPKVTIVFLAFNRREELATSLRRMLGESGYPNELLDVVVVDNASADDTVDMLRESFHDVAVIARSENIGVSAWNDGFAMARGDYVLALDDDCYLPSGGLGRAVEAARDHGADLVSFAVAAAEDPGYRFTDMYVTGLLSFWGCAVLMRRRVLTELIGYDPEIFVWANELEFMVRFFDRGFRHLHLPEVVAVHMKEVPRNESLHMASYRRNSRHFAYIAAKSLRARDLPGVVLALFTHNVRDAIRVDRAALAGVGETARGLARGARLRAPVRREVSQLYSQHFHSLAGPRHFLGATSGTDDSSAPAGRRDRFIAARKRYYPDRAATLDL